MDMVSYVLYKDKLKDAYLKAFDYVEAYAVAMDVPDQDLEEMLNHLLDTLYEAQENGKPVEKIVGSDLKQFCENYFQDYTYLGNFMKNLAPMFYRFSIFIFLFSLVELGQLEEDVTLFHATTDVGGYLCGAICGILAGIIATAVAKTFLFRSKKFTHKMFTWMVIVIFVVAIVLSMIICEDVNIMVPLFSVLLVSGGYIVLYKLIELVRRYQKYGSIKKSVEEKYTLKDTMKEMWNSANRDNQYELLDTLVKMYQKKNARLSKRGKEGITPEAYTEKVRKDAKMEKYNLPYFVVLFIICVVGPVFFTEFEGVGDLIVFLVIMIVVEGGILRFLYKCSKAGCEEKAALIAQCDAKGITLVELWERKREEKNIECGDEADT